MKTIIRAMLELQDKLNVRTIGPNWRTQGQQDWHLAISQECAEGIDHMGWKWWTKQLPDVAAARIEVIDILHFVLSAEMWAADGISFDVIADQLNESWERRYEPVFLDEDEFNVADGTPVQLFQLISGLATVARTNLGLLILLAEKLNLNALDVSILYRQKATLNLFRQNHGYKEGAYIKQWAPSTEDNAFLTTLSEGINWGLPTAQDLLYGRLNVKYTEVVRSHQKH